MIEWLDGKDKNVRALLCTLGAVLWDGVRWEQISVADVMTVKQVKQQYRKAARAVHPDKVKAAQTSTKQPPLNWAINSMLPFGGGMPLGSMN